MHLHLTVMSPSCRSASSRRTVENPSRLFWIVDNGCVFLAEQNAKNRSLATSLSQNHRAKRKLRLKLCTTFALRLPQSYNVSDKDHVPAHGTCPLQNHRQSGETDLCRNADRCHKEEAASLSKVQKRVNSLLQRQRKHGHGN